MWESYNHKQALENNAGKPATVAEKVSFSTLTQVVFILHLISSDHITCALIGHCSVAWVQWKFYTLESWTNATSCQLESRIICCLSQKPAFASHSGTSTGDLGNFFRECQTAPPLSLFQDTEVLSLDNVMVSWSWYTLWAVYSLSEFQGFLQLTHCLESIASSIGGRRVKVEFLVL